MAELVDALDSGSSRGNSVDVRVILAANPSFSLDKVTCAALVANGAMGDPALLADAVRRFPLIVAVDGGLNHLHAMAIRPHLIVGDFDSLDLSLLSHYREVPQYRVPAAKDETDLELALRLLEPLQLPRQVLFGALSQRTDHALANLFLLARYAGRLEAQSETERIVAVKGHLELNTRPGQLISLMPLGMARGVSTQGLRWEINHKDLSQSFFSLSNEALGNRVSITLDQGDLLLFTSAISGSLICPKAV